MSFPLKDALLGLWDSFRGALRVLASFVVALCFVASLTFIWSIVVPITIENDSDGRLEGVALYSIDEAGKEKLLWRGDVASQQSDFTLTLMCCRKLVVRHLGNQAECRPPSMGFAPRYTAIVGAGGEMACGGDSRLL